MGLNARRGAEACSFAALLGLSAGFVNSATFTKRYNSDNPGSLSARIP